MDRQTRIALLVDHFKHPRHRGVIEHPDVSMPGGNPGCGDVVTMHVRAAEDEDRIAEVSFEGEGCTISQAAASILAQRANRKHYTFDEVAAMSYEEMIDLLGSDIVGSRPRCATLALGTLKAAVKRIEMDRKLRAAGHTDEEIAQMRAAIARQAAGELVFGEEAVAKVREEDSTAAHPDRDLL
ncbi:MAG: iron-sulfur cluster assembly scaffold protein [Candidatus Cloacimonetes bacterium]|nr:iron-sulfur cluster assembly scaffold protein [Candidatus Cloacimonadota bacterium]